MDIQISDQNSEFNYTWLPPPYPPPVSRKCYFFCDTGDDPNKINYPQGKIFYLEGRRNSGVLVKITRYICAIQEHISYQAAPVNADRVP